MSAIVTPVRVVVAAVALVAVLFAVGWATREDPAEQPYLQILGGGFIFNYRIAEIRYGFTARVARPLESGAVIEAAFENPAGGPPLVVRERVSTMTDRYALRSPPVRGVEADRPYRVAIRVLDRREDTVLWSFDKTYTSRIADTVVPDSALTVGPGYHRNPERM
ncbi:hypothetical protein N1F89_07895 [Aquibium sp. A9E412]|uniref:hypothetical protein n=1 Tax=Aquibium sp. A9E412 TaxID=2976767 RepID=UPI0025AFEE5F|nr:hypothetical protein [Aquibium sp. A9E412]MDN2566140.1 hypothetical protein [Aquibium sp. A9E412]